MDKRRDRREEEKERWEKRALRAKRENEVWEIINRERRKRRRINEGINMREWEEYFKSLLGGVKNKVSRGDGVRRKEGMRKRS